MRGGWKARCVVTLGLALLACRAVCAQAPASVAEQYLFQEANAERVSRGLPALRWDGPLQEAARQHAAEMAARESISHQYSGEPDVAERAQSAGARFSVVAENVAEAPTAIEIEIGWMNSPHHRANLLDPRVDRVGISVLRRQGRLYAVEDFDRTVAVLSFAEQESAVEGLLAAASPVGLEADHGDARQTCAMETGFAGERRPWFVMRFTSGELDALPEELRERLATGKYRRAAVGACPVTAAGSFSGYRVAVLLFP